MARRLSLEIIPVVIIRIPTVGMRTWNPVFIQRKALSNGRERSRPITLIGLRFTAPERPRRAPEAKLLNIAPGLKRSGRRDVSLPQHAFCAPCRRFERV